MGYARSLFFYPSGAQRLIGLLGGSFDPIHLGHLHLAKSLCSAYGFNPLYLVPAGQNPLKGCAQAPAKERWEMVVKALEELGDSRLQALNWEITRSTPSYTIDTVRKLCETEKTVPCLIVGDEIWGEIPRWKTPQALLHSCHLIVATRTGKEVDLLPQLLKCGIQGVSADPQNPNRLWHSGSSRWVERFCFSPLPYSSSAIREALKQNASMPQGIPNSVWHVIQKNRLYAVK